MQILFTTWLLIVGLAAGSSPASAQSLILITYCEYAGGAGPTLSDVQPSRAVDTFCSDLTPENRDFCLAVDAFSSEAGTGKPCADAMAEVHALGFEKTFLSAVATSPRAAHEATHVFQNNQTNLEFVMERAAGIDLIGCSVLPGEVSQATYRQMSDISEIDDDGFTCADAMQESVDEGSVLSDKRSSTISGGAAVRNQQGRLAVDSDPNESSRSEFVIVRIGQKSLEPN